MTPIGMKLTAGHLVIDPQGLRLIEEGEVLGMVVPSQIGGEPFTVAVGTLAAIARKQKPRWGGREPAP